MIEAIRPNRSPPLMAAKTMSDPVDRVDQSEQDREHQDPEKNRIYIHAIYVRARIVSDPCRSGRTTYRFYAGRWLAPAAWGCGGVASISSRTGCA
jgi:hypothetical protein